MNSRLFRVLHEGRRFYIENKQELDDTDRKYLSTKGVLELIEDVQAINNVSNFLFYITEVAETFATLVANKKEYSLGYIEGLDCVAIFEEVKEGEMYVGMKFVDYIHGTMRDILKDETKEGSIKNNITKYEKMKKINSNHEMLKCNLTDLSKFKNHISNSINEMLDNDDHDNEKYSLNITLNNKTINLGNNADIFNDLITLVNNEIKELSTAVQQNLIT